MRWYFFIIMYLDIALYFFWQVFCLFCFLGIGFKLKYVCCDKNNTFSPYHTLSLRIYILFCCLRSFYRTKETRQTLRMINVNGQNVCMPILLVFTDKIRQCGFKNKKKVALIHLNLFHQKIFTFCNWLNHFSNMHSNKISRNYIFVMDHCYAIWFGNYEVIKCFHDGFASLQCILPTTLC